MRKTYQIAAVTPTEKVVLEWFDNKADAAKALRLVRRFTHGKRFEMLERYEGPAGVSFAVDGEMPENTCYVVPSDSTIDRPAFKRIVERVTAFEQIKAQMAERLSNWKPS